MAVCASIDPTPSPADRDQNPHRHTCVVLGRGQLVDVGALASLNRAAAALHCMRTRVCGPSNWPGVDRSPPPHMTDSSESMLRIETSAPNHRRDQMEMLSGTSIRAPAASMAALRARRWRRNIRRLPLLLLGWAGAASAFGWRLRPTGSPLGLVASWRANGRGPTLPAAQPRWYQQQLPARPTRGGWAWGTLPIHAAAAAAAADGEQAQEQGATTTTATTTTTEFTVESGGWPMDIVLARQFPQLSRRACRRLLQEGHVRVDGKGASWAGVFEVSCMWCIVCI